MLGYLRSLRQLALFGNNIVTEVMITPDRLQLYLDLFGDLPVLLVGLHIPLEEAQRWEGERTGRHQPFDIKAQHVELVHAHGVYDLELDMVQLRPMEAARQVLALIANPPVPKAFQQLTARKPARP